MAQDERVLAKGILDHELVGLRAAHDADVGADDDGLETEPLEDARVRVVMEAVAPVEPVPVDVAAVGVLHRELANPDEPAPRAWFVAELRLEVVDDDGQLAIALHDVAEEER